MAQVSRATFASDLATKIPSGTPGAVSAQDIREVITDLEDSAVWYDEGATLTGTETLTNKTLPAPVLGGTVTGTYTLGGTPTIGAATYSGAQDLNGQQVEAYVNKVVTSVSGTLNTTDHAGNILVTSGNVTVPTTAGFNCILIAGGAHTVTFNGTTSAAMAAGDLMSVVVESGTVIHAVLTEAANKVGFS